MDLRKKTTSLIIATTAASAISWVPTARGAAIDVPSTPQEGTNLCHEELMDGLRGTRYPETSCWHSLLQNGSDSLCVQPHTSPYSHDTWVRFSPALCQSFLSSLRSCPFSGTALCPAAAVCLSPF